MHGNGFSWLGHPRDYAALARWDKPIGTWLLLIPCWLGGLLALHEVNLTEPVIEHALILAFYFAAGALLMRGAGCTWNDIIDRKADKFVERTQHRPVACGNLSLTQALAFLIVQSLLGFWVLWQLPKAAIIVGVCSLPLVLAYPFVKRFSHWPQAWLGFTFNWGVWVGAFAISARAEPLPLLLLYGAMVFWTLGYDSVYALQDREDDRKIGVKSTAVLFGDAVALWVGGFYFVCHALMAGIGFYVSAGVLFWMIWLLAGGHLLWQFLSLRVLSLRVLSLRGERVSYARLFRSNRDYGLLLVCSFIGALL